jgi:hypothetical protein
VAEVVVYGSVSGGMAREGELLLVGAEDDGRYRQEERQGVAVSREKCPRDVAAHWPRVRVRRAVAVAGRGVLGLGKMKGVPFRPERRYEIEGAAAAKSTALRSFALNV